MQACLKPHIYNELLNKLRDCADEYHGKSSLHDRLDIILSAVIGLDTPFPASSQLTSVKEADVSQQIVEVLVEVPVEVIKTVEVRVEVPVEVRVEVPVEVIKTVEVEVIKEIIKTVEVEVIKEIIKTVEVPAVVEWQTFDTAPKDGTHILAHRHKMVTEIWWQRGLFEPGWGGNGWTYTRDEIPSHWLPVPKFQK